MSEENNLSSSSICTTEDVFEKFQAKTVFDEEEFITLSDIIPSQPEAPDLSNDQNLIPFDNEVVLTTTNDDDLPLRSNIQSQGKNESLEQHDKFLNEDTHRSLGTTTPLKRGRAKAKSIQCTSVQPSDLESENNSTIDNQAVQDNVLSTTVHKNGIGPSNELQRESNYPRRTRRERIPNTLKYPLIAEKEVNNTQPVQSTAHKRRGRPKKSNLEQFTISEPDSTNIDASSLVNEVSNSVNDGLESSKQTTGKRGRRGRPRLSEVDLDQNNPNNSTSNITEIKANTGLTSEAKKPNRRGRKKVEKSIDNQSSNAKEINESQQHTELSCVGSETGITQVEIESKQNETGQDNYIDKMEIDDDDDGDDICLSKLKENISNISNDVSDDKIDENMQDIDSKTDEVTDNKNAEVTEIGDFEYHIDKIVQDTSLGASSLDDTKNLCNSAEESLLVEDTSRRPNRRKVKQNFKYDEDSAEEDPYANMELSDDDEPRPRKKGRYADDDDYVPRGKKNRRDETSSSDSELNEDVDNGKLKRRVKVMHNLSPKKRGRKQKSEPDIMPAKSPPIVQTEDEPLSMKPPAEAWATSNEFENFIAQKIQGTSSLKIKKVSTKQKTDSVLTPLEIPVLDLVGPKKSIETGSQTTKTVTVSTGIQTCVPYDIPISINTPLTTQQSEKACAFLNSVVNTTAELGQLMKDKSVDFMKKKINTSNVTDTYKMDYCVRKSFLLFKLAKHNLLQMEDDLAKQYDEFLRSNNLSFCRDEPKVIKPNQKEDSDSDCEIVDVKEVPSTSSKEALLSSSKEKAKLNKTVFLNKELSIKIAKKPSTDKNVDVKGRQTIWINDSVMVKKVKPTQSFLAQDSRNKKPPDNVTEKMVSDFFENYYHHQRAITVCAPYINTEWTNTYREYACHYFVKCDDLEPKLKNAEMGQNIIEINPSTSNGNCSDLDDNLETHKNNPKLLTTLCTDVVRRCLNVCKSNGEINEDLTCDLTDGKETSGPLSLFRLCYLSLPRVLHSNMSNKLHELSNITQESTILIVPPLKYLCYKRITQLMLPCKKPKDHNKYIIENTFDSDGFSGSSSYGEDINCHDEEYLLLDCHLADPKSADTQNKVQSLLSLCVTSIQVMYTGSESCSENYQMINPSQYIDSKTRSPKSLKYIAYESIKCLLFGDKVTKDVENMIFHTEAIYDGISMADNSEDFTINCINTMSEEAFYNIEPDNEEFENDDIYEPDVEGNEEGEWVSQVQMTVLESTTVANTHNADNQPEEMSTDDAFLTSAMNSAQNDFADTNNENNFSEFNSENNTCQNNGDIENQFQNIPNSAVEHINISTRIKIEPQDEITDNVVDPSIVKIEPVHGLDGMTIIPESIVTKSEMMEHALGHNTEAIANELTEKEATVFNMTSFEQFVRKNKLMHRKDDDSDEENVFEPSGRRERREHEPDYDAEHEESLLIPQTYEPSHIDTAKGVLMASSSDEGNKDGKKKQNKKKTEKKKAKQKKVKEVPKLSNVKEISIPTKEAKVPEKPKDTVPTNEVAMLTRKMREKIRQEEKKIESSDSETENLALSSRKDKGKVKENEKVKPKKYSKQGEPSNTVTAEHEIQCNDVDSTDPTLENRKSKEPDEFTGFSAIDQNEISSYQKYMQFVYDKIVPTEEENVQENSEPNEISHEGNKPGPPIISPDQPVELLECEPSLPIFDNENVSNTKRPKKGVSKKKESKPAGGAVHIPEPEQIPFTESNGWHLYRINAADPKLYQSCLIPLEKLPESFVAIYQEYQDITDKDNVDKEIDKLANLQSLNRATSFKEGKSISKQKVKSSTPSEQNSENLSRAVSPANSEYFHELTPSDDDGANIEDEQQPPVPVRATENIIAKDSLMHDNESDSDGGTKKIKQELTEEEQVEEKRRPGPKSKTRIIKPKAATGGAPSQPIMLTADKMMNKELTLLHAPIVMKEEVKEISPKKEPTPKEENKPKKRSLRNTTLKDRLKTEDDSSSEEEKQWVSTKEKLLKRIGKKDTDDAKRAKLVDDFIERRGEGPETRRVHVRSSRRSRKKMLEKLKQQRFLSKELLGDPSSDQTPAGKRGANVGLFKGRRNIRKVIDKKSLQKSTVLANMEEFERKRRLNAKLNQLRELLGCEEGVNVLVINDEVCLEYDFEDQRPIVTVHPFFTKVMKAHQYEGVKFMWDACFESLSSIEAGHPGGGCILAHCMGLGKTLQVLALLHTVLTHPRSAMHRVLVCCPLSTVLNWVDEIHKWIGPVTNQIKVFELSKLKKTYERAYQLEDWYNGGGIFIIGYELFRSLTTLDPLIDEVRPTIINKIRTALLDPGPDIIICDEGHLLKNDCSVLAVAMSRVVTRRRIVLTGTPMQNNLREYYCMVNFVKPNLLGTYSEYSNRFENPIMNGQHRDSSQEDIKLMKARTHILHKVLEGCLQRQEASVLYPYLPKKHEYTVFIPLTKCQWDLYKHYVHNYTKESKQSVLRDFHILQKIWSHPLVLHNFSTREKGKEIKPEKLEDDLALEDKEDIKPPATETWWLQYLAEGAMLNSIDTSNKFVAVFRILHECITLGDKVLIFSTSLDCLDALEYFLRQINGWNLGQEYYRLDGSVPPEVRQKWVREFNAENNHKTKLFLISTRAGCLGLNMTAANRVIILDTSWNPAHDIQSIFRVYRFGQKKDCYIYRLVAMGTMEQKIYERSVTKQAVACRVVDEQQIDRHYNMAELTELYRFDELGVGVAGGVAVGVADVALLRVARDAAVHAVHEHDSLLRGSGEQGLPEHERAAAWMQFQQEHAHKQMQNDIETDKAARALKKLQERQELEARQQLEKQKAQVLNIKTEAGPVHDLLVPLPDPAAPKGRGGARYRGRRQPKIVQCRIPITQDQPQPGPSRPPPPPTDDEFLVQQISSILLKHNYTETRKGPKQIKELIAKVKKMTQQGQVSFNECDELTASIAKVLLQRQSGAAPPSEPAPVTAPAPAAAPATAMPPLTDVDSEPRRRGRPKRTDKISRIETPIRIDAAEPRRPLPEPPAEVEGGGRRRRRAAIAAERQFEELDDGASQDSVPNDPVIDVDDDWNDSDTDSAPEALVPPIAPAPPALKETKPSIPRKRTRKALATEAPIPSQQTPDDSSILLSDDEQPSTRPIVKSEKNKETTNLPTPLHPSLLSNQNFVKIVAHTYLAGNPSLDEDAATLAAQYSTFKLLKETEDSGNPIRSGPIYDIAVKVLGEPVLKKLQQHPPNSKSKDIGVSKAASSKMAKFLNQDSAPATPSPVSAPEPTPPPEPTPSQAPMKRRPGPKSRVKAVSEEPVKSPKPAPTANHPPLRPIVLRRMPGSLAPTPVAPSQAEESILPDDDDDVHCITELPPPPKVVNFKVKLPPLKKEQPVKTQPAPEPQKPAIRVSSGKSAAKPAPVPSSASMATICLDSDDDESPPQASVPRAHIPAAGAPVPVALTGPNSQPLPLGVPPPQASPAPRPTYYSYPKPSRYSSEPVSVSFTGPGSHPVPISLTGPDNQPVPLSLSGPGFQAVPISVMQAPGASYPTVTQVAAGSHATSTATAYPVQVEGGALPTVMLPGGQGGIRSLRLTLAPGQGSTLQSLPNNMFLLPASEAGDRAQPRAVPLPGALQAPSPKVTKTYCKPGDILRLTPSGTLEIIKSSANPVKTASNPPTSDVIHNIDDDEQPTAVPTPQQPKTSTFEAPKPSPSAGPASRTRDQKATGSQKAATVPKPPVTKKALSSRSTPVSEEQERRKRKISSSSSSSNSSRSPTPDPLSILKDVVHIQAPSKDKSSSKLDTSSSSTSQTKYSTSQTKSSSKSSSPQPSTSIGKPKSKDKSLAEVLNSMKSKNIEMNPKKSKLVNNNSTPIGKIKEAIDLTETTVTTLKSDSRKTIVKLKPPSFPKKEGTSTVVGTSKSIILVAKSKSLTNKETVNDSAKNVVQVTNMKTIPATAASTSAVIKQKILEQKKRAASSTETAAPKKKKTELMTLKDFDIDDIDDIIELE